LAVNLFSVIITSIDMLIIIGRKEKNMYKLLLVGLGGAVGASGRYLSATMINRLLPGKFPYGTLTVNLIGCLLIGILATLAETKQLFSPEARFFIIVGVLGSFTTFSTFGFETFTLFRNTDSLLAFLNIGFHLIAGLAAVWFGHIVTKTVF